MAAKQTKPGKNGGRPRLLSDQDRETVRHLYYEGGWTGRRISEALFPEIATKTIQKIAAVEQARKRNAPAAATGEGATNDTGNPASATDSSIAQSPALGGAKPAKSED